MVWKKFKVQREKFKVAEKKGNAAEAQRPRSGKTRRK
jgi:hypothetical protein